MTTPHDARLDGPCAFYAFDIDNPTPRPLRVRLVRDSGQVVIDASVVPYNTHGVSFDGRENWAWSTPDSEPVYVPDGQSLHVEVTPRIDELRLYWSFARSDRKEES